MQVTNEAFTAIVEETKAVVISAIRQHLFENYKHAVEDVVQEVYLRAFRSLVKGSFEKRSKLSTWLYTIAKNEAIRMNYRLKREEQKKDFVFFFSKKTFVSENDESPELDSGEIVEKIGLLPVRFRSIIMMHYEGTKEEEIAEKLELPRGTVKSRIHKGKIIMRGLLKKAGLEANNEKP